MSEEVSSSRSWHPSARPGVALCVVALVTALSYARALDRYFVADDFPILRYLAQGDFWETFGAILSDPWLGLTYIKFYRPFSTLVLHGEFALFGVWSAGYLWIHLGIHLLNTVLLHRVARRLTRDPITPLVAALLFALYPLGPNTVVFVGAFATLFYAAPFLGAVLLFLRHLDEGRWIDLAGSLFCFALAMGCYEAALVLPGVLAAADALFFSFADGRRHWRALLTRQLPFVLLIAVYFPLRRAILGTFTGGYQQLIETMAPGADWNPFARIWLDWSRLVLPVYAPGRAGWIAEASTIAVGGLAILFLVRWLRGRKEAGLGLFALWWIFLTQLPFNFQDVLPPEGRYWYLSAGGLGLLVSALVRSIVPPPRAVAAVATAGLVLGTAYLVLLNQYVGHYARAGDTARAVQQQIIESVSRQPVKRIFLKDPPEFEYDAAGIGISQVFLLGLGDALQPPFVDVGVPVYPLPNLPLTALAPLLQRGDLGVVRAWQAGQGGQLVPVPARARSASKKIPLVEALEDSELRIRFRAAAGQRYSLIVLTYGGPLVVPLPRAAAPGGIIEASLPRELVRSAQRFGSDDILWWIAASDRSGRSTAFSEIQTLLAVEPHS